MHEQYYILLSLYYAHRLYTEDWRSFQSEGGSDTLMSIRGPAFHWLQKALALLIYDLSKHFADEFIVTVPDFNYYWIQDDHFVSCGSH